MKFIKSIFSILLVLGIIVVIIFVYIGYLNYTYNKIHNEENKKLEIQNSIETIRREQVYAIYDLAMKKAGKDFINGQRINFSLEPLWQTNNHYYRIGTLTDVDNGENIIIIETDPALIIGTGANIRLMDEKIEGLETYIITKSSDDSHCKMLLKIVPKEGFGSLYELAPECLNQCEKLHQMVIKSDAKLSIEDIKKIDPSCI